MKILVDIGHPAHVHYFRNFIKIMEKRKHSVTVFARDREVVFDLLSKYSIKFINRGKGRNSKFGKIIYMFKTSLFIVMKSIKFNPDIFLSFSSPYAAQASFLLRKPHITINDTEHADRNNKLFVYPFTDIVLTPFCFFNNLGRKQIRFNCIVESLYLHSEFYQPDSLVYNTLKIKNGIKYAIIRLVGWNAHHDFGQSGLDVSTIHKIVRILKKNNYVVFISSEMVLDDSLKEYELSIPSEKMHDVLYFSSIFIGESGTMASESVYFGKPTIYVNSLPLMGYLKLESDAKLLKHFSSQNGVVEYVMKTLSEKNFEETNLYRKNRMIKNFINPTKFLVWFIENYPKSATIMKENPEYQNRFK
ncbi:MAG: DUF354 domain-containing protein [Flavobacteriaceae bacterium]|nr:DUF354 domain-containing protein [Flavobacteriaceae bacterium]